VLLEREIVAYFGTRDLAGITILAALSGVLSATISPILFQVFHLPFACDLIVFAAVTLAVWYVRKAGTSTLIGIIATIINFIFRPMAFQFLGFTAAAVVFDVLASSIGYKRLFEKRLAGSLSLLMISVFSAGVAGLIIGSLFMPPTALIGFGGVLGWVGLHAIGGVMGGAVGVSLMNALTVRGIIPQRAEVAKRIEK